MATWFGRDRWSFCSRLGGWLLLGYARAFDHPILARFRLNDVPIGWFVALPLCIPYLQWIWYRVRTEHPSISIPHTSRDLRSTSDNEQEHKTSMFPRTTPSSIPLTPFPAIPALSDVINDRRFYGMNGTTSPIRTCR